jgi:spore maturation protein CgeB
MSLRVKLFCHSIVSDWNHGNAHFLRGVLSDMAARGLGIESLEPEDSWSRLNLEKEHGSAPAAEFSNRFPSIPWRTYNLERESVDELIGDADIAIVHEWNSPDLIADVGRARSRNRKLRLFFHDTHHRAVTASNEMRLNDLAAYDGILVYGQTLKDAYQKLGWTSGVHVWHEAADTRIFKPATHHGGRKGLVWVGNWGDDERTKELQDFLIDPVKQLGIPANVYGVRYPEQGVEQLRDAGIAYGGWLANYLAPEVFSRHQVTVHVPRRPYLQSLVGIPTIRPFEAMACCLPLICSPWNDSEGLFREGEDYLMARTGEEMRSMLHEVLNDEKLAGSLGRNGFQTIQKRHTCTHRVDEFLAIYDSVAPTGQAMRDEVTLCE